MKLRLRFTWMTGILLLITVHAGAQKKKMHSGARQAAVSSQHLMALFSEDEHIFKWGFARDTLLPASVMYKETIEIQNDSVLIKKYYNKKAMPYHTSYEIDYGRNEDNPVYRVINRKAAYKFSGEIILIMNVLTKRYDRYKLMRLNYKEGYGALQDMQTKRKYTRQGQVMHIAPKEDEPE